MYHFTPCGQPRYTLKYRHHHWQLWRRTGGIVVPLSFHDTLHEAHKAIEGDIAALKAAVKKGDVIGYVR